MNVAPGQIIPVSALGVVGRDEDGEVDWVAMVARDISELKEAEERLRRLATSDHLTGLANRALFTEQLEEVVARGNRTGRGLAVLFCDLDRFKEVNDEHGHADGDDVLVEIADRLLTIIRGDDMVARVGGDEFVILCDGSIDPDALAALAERVIETVHQPIDVGRRAGAGRHLDRRGHRQPARRDRRPDPDRRPTRRCTGPRPPAATATGWSRSAELRRGFQVGSGRASNPVMSDSPARVMPMSSRPSRKRCRVASSSGNVDLEPDGRRRQGAGGDVDGQLEGRIGGDGLQQVLVDVGVDLHRHQPVLGAVVAEDVGEARARRRP